MVELPELDHALQKTEKSLTMYAVMMHSASRRIVPAVLIAVVLAVPAAAQEFAAGEPIGALNEAGVWQPMSDNVTVYGSFHFSGSSHKCVHDSAPAGRPRRGKRVRMRSCQLTSGEVVCRSVDGRLRGPRF